MSHSSHTRKMQGAEYHSELERRQGKIIPELDLNDLTRCAACYSHVPRCNDSSSSEGSGSGGESESSSCSSESDTEDWTQDTLAPVEAARGPTTESPERSTGRSLVSVLLDSHSPKVQSVLNLQVLPPRHTYDPHYTIRRQPVDMPLPDENSESFPSQPSVPLQLPPTLPYPQLTPPSHEHTLPWPQLTPPSHEHTLPYPQLTPPSHEHTLPWPQLTPPSHEHTLPYPQLTPPSHEHTLPWPQLTPSSHEHTLPWPQLTPSSHEHTLPYPPLWPRTLVYGPHASGLPLPSYGLQHQPPGPPQ